MNLINKNPLQIRQEAIAKHFQLRQEINNFKSNLKNNLLYGHKNNILNCGLLLSNQNSPASYAGGGWTFQEPFTDDQTTLDARWPQSGTLIKPVATADNFDWDGIRETTNHAMSHDLTTISDTANVSRVKLTIDAITTVSYTAEFGFGLSSTPHSTGGTTSPTDKMIFAIQARGATDRKFYFGSIDGGAWASPQFGQNGFTNLPNASTSYWFQYTRLSATTSKGEIFTDAYVTSLESKSPAIASTVQSLRYILFQNDNNSALTTLLNGTGDDIYFADGVTIAP